MRRTTWLRRVTLGLCLGLAVAGCGDDGGSDSDPDSDRSVETSGSSTPAPVDDAAWCQGWQQLVQVQGAYVASPVPEAADAVLSVVGTLQELGVPESLDPSGYTELQAVLDDVRASVDPSFTPSIAPSEPADVGEGHDHGDEGQAEDEHAEAPFGTWLADHCAA